MPSLLQEQLKETDKDESKPLPTGVVLGKDGKPCKSCTSSAAWMSMMKGSTTNPKTKPIEPASIPSDCPPDVEQLGNASWTLLHSLTANYPEQPDQRRGDMNDCKSPKHGCHDQSSNAARGTINEFHDGS